MQIYSTSPFCVRSEGVALVMRSELAISPGSMDLTPFAVRWRLAVHVLTNGQPAHFDLVENMLRAMLEGLKPNALQSSLESYKQTQDGFILVFAPGLVDSASAHLRRYVKTVSVKLEYVHTPQTTQELFERVLMLGDYALVGMLRAMMRLAPAVFSTAYEQVRALTPTLRPLQLGLNLRSRAQLEVACERNLQANALAEIPDRYCRMFFAHRDYVPHEFVVLVDDGEPCTHELVCWDHL